MTPSWEEEVKVGEGQGNGAAAPGGEDREMSQGVSASLCAGCAACKAGRSREHRVLGEGDSLGVGCFSEQWPPAWHCITFISFPDSQWLYKPH